MRATLLGGVEAGGTKWVCVVGRVPDDLVAERAIPTTTPAETLARVVEFLAPHAAAGALAAVGVASFGPLDLDPASPTFGRIRRTPKPGWAGADVVGPLRRALGVPVAIDTDVNAAALAEHRWGAARGADPCVYVTVGTGIGGGAVVHGGLLHGIAHPEMGHLAIPREPGDRFPGACPIHGDCWEGLASAVALRERWGASSDALPAEHPAWPLEAAYLARGLASVVAILAPRCIVLGGGVMRRPGLREAVRERLRALLGDYYVDLGTEGVGRRGDAPRGSAGAALERYLAAPALGGRAGVIGALALASDALAVPRAPA